MSDPRLAAAAAAVAVLALLALGLRVRRWARSRRARRRAEVALSGERTAERLLTRAGFAVVDRQVGHRWAIAVDDATVTAGLRCDYLADRAGERWVAEVKTGQDAPRLDNPATRRQLLEYQVAYGVAGVLLVDAGAGTVREVRFDLGAALTIPRSPPARWRWLVAGAALGAAVMAALQG